MNNLLEWGIIGGSNLTLGAISTLFLWQSELGFEFSEAVVASAHEFYLEET